MNHPYSIFIYLIFLIFPYFSIASDVFCGNLTVFEQQRFGSNSVAILSQETTDLKQCLQLCCSVVNCNAVTFIGIVSSKGPEPNCLLIACRGGECETTPKEIYDTGVISVKLSREIMESDIPILNTTYTPTSSDDAAKASSHGPKTLAPVWAMGLAIVICVVCVGLTLSLLSAYICYRRKQSKKQTAHISTNKGPTLHAYNPPL